MDDSEITYDVIYGTDGTIHAATENNNDDDDDLDEQLNFARQFDDDQDNEQDQLIGKLIDPAVTCNRRDAADQKLQEVVRLYEWIEWEDLDSDLKDLGHSIGRQISSKPGGKNADRWRTWACQRSGKPEKDVSSSQKCGCPFHLNFIKKQWRTDVRGETIRLSAKSTSFSHDERCIPNLVTQEGNIVKVEQLTPVMLDFIRQSFKDIPVCLIRDSLQTEHDIDYIACHTIRTAIRRMRQQDASASQISKLLARLRASPQKYEVRVLWKRATRDGKPADELTNMMFATQRMLMMIRKFGAMIVVDATYRTNQFKRPLLIFTVRTATGAFTIGAVAVLAAENDACMEWAFAKLRSMVGEDTWNNIRLVMTDGHLSYPKVVAAMPNAQHQICWWHQSIHLKSTAKKFALGDWKKAWEEMREATLLISDESKALAKWSEMRARHFTKKPNPPSNAASSSKPAQSNNNISNTATIPPAPISMHNLPLSMHNLPNSMHSLPLPNPHVLHPVFTRSVTSAPDPVTTSISSSLLAHSTSSLAYPASTTTNQQSAAPATGDNANVTAPSQKTQAEHDWQLALARLDKWFEDRHLYWRCYTQHYRNFGSVSTQGSESMNSVVKKRRRFMTLDDLIRALEKASSRHYWVMLENIFKGQTNKDIAGADAEMMNKLRTGVTDYAAHKLLVQLKFAEMVHADGFRAIGDNMFTTTSKSHGAVTINLTNKHCSCGLIDNMGLMCRHVMRLMLTMERRTRYDLVNSCFEWADDRWKQLSQRMFMNASTPQLNSSDETDNNDDCQEQHEIVTNDSMTQQVVQTTKNSSRLEMQDDWDRYVSLYRNADEAHLLRTMMAETLLQAQTKIEQMRVAKNQLVNQSASINTTDNQVAQPSISIVDQSPASIMPAQSSAQHSASVSQSRPLTSIAHQHFVSSSSFETCNNITATSGIRQVDPIKPQKKRKRK